MAIRGFGDLFSDAMSTYREHQMLFFKLGFLLYLLPLSLLEIAAAAATASGLSFFGIRGVVAFASLSDLLIPLLVGIVKSALSWLFTIFFTIAVIKVLTLHRARGVASANGAVHESSPYLGKAVLLSVILNLALIALFFLFIIPAVIFGVFWAFALYALVVDNTGVAQAMRQSRKIVSGRWWRVFGYLLLLFLIVFAVELMVLLPVALVIGLLGGLAAMLLGLPWLLTAVGVLISVIVLAVNMVVLPFIFTFAERFYVNLRDETHDLYDVKRV